MTPSLRPVAPTFERLDRRNGWRMSPAFKDVSADLAIGAVRLGSRDQRPVRFDELGGTFGGLTRPTGLAVGPDGRLFLADPGSNRILSYTPHDAEFRPLWESVPTPAGEAPNAYSLRSPRGVAFSPSGDLVVTDTGHGRVVVYTWPTLQPRRVIDLAGGQPWDLAHDVDGYLYVADAAAGRVRRFDSRFWEDQAYLGGAPYLQRPIGLAIDADDNLFVLDERRGERDELRDERVKSHAEVVALDRRGRRIEGFEPESLVERVFPPPLRLEGGTLSLPQDDRPDCPALPLPGLAVDRGGRLPGVGALLLARPLGTRYPRVGKYVSEALDSGIVNCAWHRIVLDTEIPPQTSVTVRTLTSPADVDPARVNELPLSRWSEPIAIDAEARPEALVQSPPGRYLWLWLELGGNGEATPLVRTIGIYAPRYSSLNYLPPVFQEDAVSASFLDRLLSYFDTVFAEIETQIGDFTGHLDPDSVPSEFLAWLGSWLDLTFLAQWPEETRRAFIRRAIELYKRRGTIAGLREFLQLHLGIDPAFGSTQPTIVEHFRLRGFVARRTAGGSVLPDGRHYVAGAPLEPAPNEIAHHFTLVVPAALAPDETAVATLRQLVEVQKPAHTAFQLRLVRPGVRVGCQSTVGVDTLIGNYPIEPLGALVLGQSGRLASPDESEPRLGQIRLVSDS